MTTSTLAFGKASAAGAIKTRLSTKTTTISKCYSTGAATAPAARTSNGAAHPKTADPTTQRDLFMNVLNANATKRDAKQYLARFKPPKQKTAPTLNPLQEERNARHRRDQDRLDRIGVNLGGLYAPARAIAESPQFTRHEIEQEKANDGQHELHVALVCLRCPEALNDATLDGVALTLSQLVKLDMRIMLVLDSGSGSNTSLKEAKQLFVEQADRLIQAIAHHSPEGAQVIDGALEMNFPEGHDSPTTLTHQASVTVPNLLLDCLKRAAIPVIPSMAYTTSGQLIHCRASNIMVALCSMLSGAQILSQTQEHKPVTLATALDRIIVLDSVGGIPSKARGDGAHVFINLQQEFHDIEDELIEYGCETKPSQQRNRQSNIYDRHRDNLGTARDCLALLPSGSSALIISPQEAASSSLHRSEAESTIGTGTRRQKNTLIHNLLTNKPTVSSSLPAARMRSPQGTAITDVPTMVTPSATLVKRGMPLAIIPPADRGLGWQAPANGRTSLDLENDPE